MLTVSTITWTPIPFTLYPVQHNKARRTHFTGAKYSCTSEYLLTHVQRLSIHSRSTVAQFLTKRARTHTHIRNRWHYSTWQQIHTQKKYLFLNTVNIKPKFPCVITQNWFIGSTKLKAPQISNRAQSPKNKFQYHVHWLQNIRQSEGKSLIKRQTKRILPYATQNQ